MTKKPDGGPVYPVPAAEGYLYGSDGMTLRDYATIKYAAAMIAHPRRYKPRQEDSHMYWHEAIHKEAADLADAMIAARNIEV